MSYQQIRKRFQSSSSDLVRACEDLESPGLLTSGAHLVPGPIFDIVARLAAEGSELGALHPMPPEPEQLETVEAFSRSPLFLGGMHKSGTTLLRNLLDGHESLCVLPFDGGIGPDFLRRLSSLSGRELHVAVIDRVLRRLLEVGGHLPPAFRRYFADDHRGTSPVERLVRSYVPLAETFGTTARGTLQAIAGAFLCMSGPEELGRKRFWAYKSTLNTLDAPQLHAMFPQARFIDIVRHPCAVYASQKKKVFHKNRSFRPYYEFACLFQWHTARLRNMQSPGSDRYHVMEYEQLVSDCSGTMRRAASFLEIPYSGELVRSGIGGLPVGANTAYTSLHGKAGEVSDSSLETWKQKLEPLEVRLVESFVRPRPAGGGALTVLADVGGFISLVAGARKLYRRSPGISAFTLREAAGMIRMKLELARRLAEASGGTAPAEDR
jgi:hypothetical protein